MSMLPVYEKYALLSNNEKLFLFNFVSGLKSNSIILEVGTFLGGSAAIMASSNPQIIVHTIDDYNDRHDRHKQSVSLMLLESLGENPRTKENVELLLKDYKNIFFHKGKSPDNFKNWETPIDVYFEDGLHRNPTLENNVNYWTKFLSKNGYVIFHDHRPFLETDHPSRFEDVIDIVQRLSSNFEIISQEESLIILQQK
jgi:hypothetical protein